MINLQQQCLKLLTNETKEKNPQDLSHVMAKLVLSLIAQKLSQTKN